MLSDKKMLDWLIESGAHMAFSKDGEDCWLHWAYGKDEEDESKHENQKGLFNSPREAIAEAIKEEDNG